ncbi:hypothetical protein GCM10011380_32800 [Sphingomonas metalli]|jgi:hypothetical protein|uniref:Uncharacterized protein n=1 Tax=Sphingomonas metalli TaxID=1779358 RepID=A0A916WYW2_9SPHN|nr:hypothetical protein [Sphingomonas metalli]GGB40776.1 hypothetical protein GCM10011380_32800 [Sphingomonas metalli]
MDQPPPAAPLYGVDVADEARRIHRCFGPGGPAYVEHWRLTCGDDAGMVALLAAIETEVRRLSDGL